MSLNGVLLPDDLVHGILLWLPVMSLLRFKTVCKSWYALIQSSCFTHQHYLHHQQHEEENYTLVMNDPNSALRFWSPRTITLPNTARPTLSVLSPHDAPSFLPQLVFDVLDDTAYSSPTRNISICNGIICLQTLDSTYFEYDKLKVYLWNPTIRQHYLLPPSPFRLSISPYKMSLQVSIGFGFDSETQDYKLLRFFSFPFRLFPGHIEIYSLHSNSWRTLDTVCPVDSVSPHRKTPYRSGTYCWMGHKILNEYSGENIILSFDFAREVFETMALPDDCVKSGPGPLLSIIRDQIAIMNQINNQNVANRVRPPRENYFEIWVLKEYGFKESWTKLYKLGPFDNALQLGLSVTGDFFLFTTDNKQLFIEYLGTRRRLTLQHKIICLQ